MSKKFSPYTVNVNCSAFSALEAIEKNSTGTVIVVDEKNKVLGTVTDGDIRKLLLEHRMLTTPVRDIMNLSFRYVCSHDDENPEKMFVSTASLRLIPVINAEGVLISVEQRK